VTNLYKTWQTICAVVVLPMPGGPDSRAALCPAPSSLLRPTECHTENMPLHSISVRTITHKLLTQTYTSMNYHMPSNVYFM